MIRIGKIVATHGLQGNLVLTHIVGASDWLKKDAVLHLELRKDSFIPYFVEGFRVSNDKEYVVQLDDVLTVESAKKLVGKTVYTEEKELAGHERDSPLLWIGFNIVDKTLGSLGAVEDVMQAGPQWLAKLNYNDKEVLVPLIEQMILDINIRNRFIRMDLPDGILDI